MRAMQSDRKDLGSTDRFSKPVHTTCHRPSRRARGAALVQHSALVGLIAVLDISSALALGGQVRQAGSFQNEYPITNRE